MPALVPELSVSDFPAALAFYLRLGWAVVHARPEDEFALLRLGDGPQAAEVLALPFGELLLIGVGLGAAAVRLLG